ncbi:MAG: hypothetical protein GY838_01195 [bacterium]|nr:hypothetical protein [bacterium]
MSTETTEHSWGTWKPVRARFWLLAAIIVIAAATVWYTPVQYTGSDSRGALLTSQTLIKTGSVRLDATEADTDSYGYRVHEHRGHTYYYFPVGSPVLALPVTLAATAFGADLEKPATDHRLQRLLAVLTLALACGIVFIWAAGRTGLARATVLTAAVVWGSSVMSTGATAYWSSNWAVILNAAALFLLSHRRETDDPGRLVLLATLLFWSYLCRPTGAVAVVVVGLLLVFTLRWRAWPYAVALTFWATFFLVWSLLEFGEPLPAYYMPGRIESDGLSSAALAGHLISPSRGLLVHSPYIAVVICGLAWRWRSFLRSPLSIACAAWLGLHWLAISQFPHWWAGHSFGARLWTEVMPAGAALALSAIRWVDRDGTRTGRRIWFTALLLTAATSVFINTAQGLYHDPSYMWNRSPDIDHHPEFLTDWRFPQFLATDAHNNRRFLAVTEAPPPLRLDVAVSATDERIEFNNWNQPEWGGEQPFRWSRGTRPLVVFSLRPDEGAPPTHLALDLGAFGRQDVTVLLDEREIGTLHIADFAPERHELELPETWCSGESLRACRHVLGFQIRRPSFGRQDPRRIAISFWGMTLTSNDHTQGDRP